VRAYMQVHWTMPAYAGIAYSVGAWLGMSPRARRLQGSCKNSNPHRKRPVSIGERGSAKSPVSIRRYETFGQHQAPSCPPPDGLLINGFQVRVLGGSPSSLHSCVLLLPNHCQMLQCAKLKAGTSIIWWNRAVFDRLRGR
jgi:hypothetical protein